MANKPLSYLQQVFNSRFYTGIMILLAVLVVYTASQLLFSDFEQYQYPEDARTLCLVVFLVAAVVLSVSFAVPAFSREKMLARRTQLGNTEPVPLYAEAYKKSVASAPQVRHFSFGEPVRVPLNGKIVVAEFNAYSTVKEGYASVIYQFDQRIDLPVSDIKPVA